MIPDIVFYHHPCSDGHCAAWMLNYFFPDATYVPVNYDAHQEDPLPFIAQCEGRNVMIVDFSFPRQTMQMMNSAANELVVLDHHKTAEEACQGLDFCKFDMNQSGAGLVKEWLEEGEFEIPYLMAEVADYVEDRDLWKFELRDSKAFNAAIRSYGLTFKDWDSFLEKQHAELPLEGEAILRYQSILIDDVCKRADLVTFAGIDRIFMVRCDIHGIVSEVGGRLARSRPFAVTFFDKNKSTRVFSLRSDKDGMDVSEIAKRFGGGGHKHAAGFHMPI